MYTLLLCLAALSAAQAASEGGSWAYTGNDGESHWPLKYGFCGGGYQSPLDFHSNILQYDSSIQPVRLYGYDASSTDSFIFSNNGHTVSMSLLPSMYMDIPPFRYIASQLHLHWGSLANPKGSEHCVGGKRFAAELHVVHYNNKYSDLATAMGIGDGVAVLGILIEIGSFNPAFENIISQLKNVKYKGQNVAISWFNVQDLLPKRLDEYYRYEGSLTTPPCSPNVLWSVFRNPVHVSEEQLQLLETTLYCTENTSAPIQMTDNYRQLQLEGNRLVFVSFREGIVISIVLASLLITLVLISLTCFLVHKKKRNQKTKTILYTAAGSKEEDTSKV